MGAFARRALGRSPLFPVGLTCFIARRGAVRSVPGGVANDEQEDFAMNARIASAPARPGDGTFAVARGAIALGAAALLTATLAGSPAFAQAPPAQPAPKAQAQAQPKA